MLSWQVNMSRWTDGSSWDYTNWAAGMPNKGIFSVWAGFNPDTGMDYFNVVGNTTGKNEL